MSSRKSVLRFAQGRKFSPASGAGVVLPDCCQPFTFAVETAGAHVGMAADGKAALAILCYHEQFPVMLG